MPATVRSAVEGAVSEAPDGVAYPIPGEAERLAQLGELAGRARAQRSAGRKVVVVQGLGFVGTAAAAVLADARDAEGRPLYFVIGVDLPTPQAYWKVA
jgi:hypothetical protein